MSMERKRSQIRLEECYWIKSYCLVAHTKKSVLRTRGQILKTEK